MRSIRICKSLFFILGVLFSVSCQKENKSTKINGTWKIQHLTENYTASFAGESSSLSYNYDLSNSDLYISFETDNSENAVLTTGTAILVHGTKSYSSSFTYSSTSNQIALNKSLGLTSVEVIDEDDNTKQTSSFYLPKELTVQSLSSRKMVLSTTGNSSVSSIQVAQEAIITLSKVN